MNTERIYYENVYTTDFEASIDEIRSDEAGLWVRLNRTAFYPEGGGQPCDVGVLCPKEKFAYGDEALRCFVRVADVQEQDGEVWHRVDALGVGEISEAFDQERLDAKGFALGTVVTGRVDWNRRLDLMQQHSGEHIVSGLIHAAYGYDNVGFHLSTDTMTIDLSGELFWEDLMEIERAANRLIRKDVPIEITYPSEEELGKIPYRSKKELIGEVRIVTIPDGDICACCGTHVSRTGEIGTVKMISMQKWKNGVRVWLCCGERAENYSRMLHEQNRKISVLLSAKPEETADAVERVSGELSQVKFELTAWKYRLFDEIAKANAGRERVVLFEEDFSMEDLRHLADRLMKVCDGECLVFSGKDGDGYRYVVGSQSGDVRSLVKEMNACLSGRGGGKPQMAQGTVNVLRCEVEHFLQRKNLL